MSKKIVLTEDDKTLFRDSVDGAQRLFSDKVILRTKRPKRKRAASTEEAAAITPYRLPLDKLNVTAEEVLYFAKSGLQTKLLRKLRRGDLTISGSLDLHGMTVAQAQQALANFLLNAAYQGKRCVLIIHGKGRNTQAILKNNIYYWLQQDDKVLAFASAKPKHGGTGAVYAILKNSIQEL